MISVGFLLSLTGVFTFFVITSGWVRAYPIKFMVTLLEQLEMKENPFEYPERAKKSAKKLLEIITKLNNTSDNFCSNFVHPFFNLFLSLPAIHYLYLLLTFIAFFLLGQVPLESSNSNTTVTETVLCGYNITGSATDGTYQIIPNKSQATFFIAVSVLMNVANLFALIIGFWWLFLLYLGCPLMCFCCFRYCRMSFPDRKHKVYKCLFGCLMAYIIGTVILAVMTVLFPVTNFYFHLFIGIFNGNLF